MRRITTARSVNRTTVHSLVKLLTPIYKHNAKVRMYALSLSLSLSLLNELLVFKEFGWSY